MSDNAPNSKTSRAGEVHRPLMTTTGLAGLGAAVLVVLGLLLPTAVRRQTLALEILPDALSLIYLDLSVARRPHDAELHFQVAKKLLEAGRFEAAHDTLAPLLTPGTRLFQRAQQLGLAKEAGTLRLEIDRQAWAAIPPRESAARARALARVVADIDAIDLSAASPARVQELAELCQTLAQPARAAALLERLARRELPAFELHVTGAETALLQADQTPRALELQVFAAERTQGPARVSHALRALELARGVLDTAQLSALAEDLRQRFGSEDPQLMAASLDLAQASDIKLAYQLAQRLARARPEDAVLRRRLAQLAEWNGYGLRALDEYMWLLRRERRAEDRAHAIDLARANWDLALLRRLLASANGAPLATPLAREAQTSESMRRGVRKRLRVRTSRGREVSQLRSFGSGSRARACGAGDRRRERLAESAPGRDSVSARRRAALRDTLALYEALGDTRAALTAVEAALRGPLGSDLETWQTKVALLSRAGDTEAAADALAVIAERFPSQAHAIALADARLALGRTRDALQALTAAPEPYSEPYLRQVFDVAWELGDLAMARQTAERLVRQPGASAWDVARLYQLQRSDPDPRVALATARAGFDRFKNAEMLRLVIESAARVDDDTRVAGLLQQAEDFGGFRTDPGYWQQRISLHQRLAFAAFEQREFVAAKRELGEAEKALERAPGLAPSQDDLYELLWTSQHAQALAIALEANDTRALARVFERYGTELPVRQRVYVLHRLERHAEAVELAKLGAADPGLSDDDREALQAELPVDAAPNRDRPNYVRAGTELFDSDGLRLWTNRAVLTLDGSALGLRAEASLTDIMPQLALRTLQPSAAREIGAELGGRLFGTELSGGVRVRQNGDPRPFGTVHQALLGERGDLLSMSAAFNALSFESSQLRLLGAADEVAVQSSIPFGGGYYVSARAAGNRYITLDREYLGAGVTIDSGVGRSFVLPSDFGRAAVRVAGRYAPRFRETDRDVRSESGQPVNWLPDTTGFSGVGASLARGELDVPNASDPIFRFLLDGTVGVMWPDQKLGWSGQAGLGSALFGTDQLSASLHAGNVVGTTPFWTLQAGYALAL